MAQVIAGAPYLAGLMTKYAQAQNYHGMDSKSTPSYQAMSSGQVLTPLGSDNCTPHVVNNVFDQLEAAGITWAVYCEDQGANPAAGVGNYVCRHNPAIYYQANLSGPRLAKLKSFTGTWKMGTERVQYVVPNIMNDMHTGSIAQGNTWLAANLPQVLNSVAFTTPGKSALLVVVFDDGGNPQNTCICMFAGPSAKLGAKSSVNYNHYNLLATLEDILGLGRIGNAVGATPMHDMLA